MVTSIHALLELGAAQKVQKLVLTVMKRAEQFP
jgi:hypothetical protein